MTLDNFISKLKNNPKTIEFKNTINTIESLYNFSPSAFKNGEIKNRATENLGSCKVFAFALKQQFTKDETLACFGQYYFKDVLGNPNGTDHQNIRNFMQTGFKGLSFEREALTEKN
ncbi:HopJ type III effector protein [Tenacibaculum adriaticum]|uniref:HopJ type III effector protein n=1 Tax=Tenacibaculum adriaticum TaxID=413713 RepID=A0A5S5DUV6_9FLAO|nr:HopJ type III effector protein [Tenacibaculum adriaticum]TYP99723.1 HopJ type III effector protein [Tenacibaculum adriaticum]